MTELSGRTTLHCHKFDNWREKEIPEDANPAVSKVWLFEAQWTLCPVEVEEQIKHLWELYEFENDNYYISTSIRDLLEIEEEAVLADRPAEGGGWEVAPVKTNLIVDELRKVGVGEEDKVLIHWWW